MRWPWRAKPMKVPGLYRNPRGEVLLILAGPVPAGWKPVRKVKR